MCIQNMITFLVSACNPTCSQIVEFPEMSHGWLPRGDMSKPEVSRDVKKTMENLFAFFSKNLLSKRCVSLNNNKLFVYRNMMVKIPMSLNFICY